MVAMPEIPPREATARYFDNMRAGGLDRTLDIAFDLDLGELIPGHHVVVRGIELATSQLHYEFVPGMTDDRMREGEGNFWWLWLLHVADDLGTQYSDDNGGAFDTRRGGPATHGARDLGGKVPPAATRLELTFEPTPGWNPPAAVVRRATVDLHRRTIAGSPA